MSSNYKSIDKFGINVQEKLDVLKNLNALRKDMISMRINIDKKYRIILDQMILKTSYISDDVNEANGICSLRNKIEKINTSIAKLKSINLDVTLLAEFGALPEKWYYRLSRDIEGVRRYLMSWQKYWINEIKNMSGDMEKIDDLYFPKFKNNNLKIYDNFENNKQIAYVGNIENSNDIKMSNELFGDIDELIKSSVIKNQEMKEDSKQNKKQRQSQNQNKNQKQNQ